MIPVAIGLITLALLGYRTYVTYIDEQAKGVQRQEFIAENPNSLAAIKERNPEKYDKIVADAQAYTDGKVARFKALSPEERRNYKGGF